MTKPKLKEHVCSMCGTEDRHLWLGGAGHATTVSYYGKRLHVVTKEDKDALFRLPRELAGQVVTGFSSLKSLTEQELRDELYICGTYEKYTWTTEEFKRNLEEWLSKPYTKKEIKTKFVTKDQRDTVALHLDDLRDLSDQGATTKAEWEALIKMREYEWEDLQELSFWGALPFFGCLPNTALQEVIKELLFCINEEVDADVCSCGCKGLL